MDGLRYDGSERFARQGFPELFAGTKQFIDSARSEYRLPIIDATPGFKAETSLLTLMGAITRTPVFYIHEEMGRPFLLPGIQLNLAGDVWKRWRRIVAAVKDCERTESGTMSAKAFFDLVRTEPIQDGDFLFEEFDSGFTLSTLGHLFLEAFEGTDQTNLPNSEVALQDRVKFPTDEHHWPKDAKPAAEGIASLPFVKKITTKEFRNSPQTRVNTRFDRENPGTIYVQKSDGRYAVLFVVETAARDQAEFTLARNQIETFMGLSQPEDESIIHHGEHLTSEVMKLAERFADYDEKLRQQDAKVKQAERNETTAKNEAQSAIAELAILKQQKRKAIETIKDMPLAARFRFLFSPESVISRITQ